MWTVDTVPSIYLELHLFSCSFMLDPSLLTCLSGLTNLFFSAILVFKGEGSLFYIILGYNMTDEFLFLNNWTNNNNKTNDLARIQQCCHCCDWHHTVSFLRTIRLENMMWREENIPILIMDCIRTTLFRCSVIITTKI